jgi:oligopeptide/dipeptide ABC transporter ATP-binding protein
VIEEPSIRHHGLASAGVGRTTLAWNESDELLRVEDLRTHFFTNERVVKAVDGVSFSVKRGEIFGLVGESGSGKSMTLRSIMRLVHPPGKIVDGRILYEGRDILPLSESAVSSLRGSEIAMIFQEPMTALDPVMRVGDQLMETLREHETNGARARAVELLKLVGLPSPERRMREYPHEYSGGMRQRAMIAIGLAADPALLLADEPTTAIDVTLQDQILRLVVDLQERLGMSVIWVTHDFGVIAMICERVGVMYAGLLLEVGPVGELLTDPRHPYTLALLESIPRFEGDQDVLVPIPGAPPDAGNRPSGCPFHPRCRFAQKRCEDAEVPLRRLSPRHSSACIRVDEIWS